MDNNSASIKLSFVKTVGNHVSIRIRVTYQRNQKRFAFPIKEGVIVSESIYKKVLKYHESGSERYSEDVKTLYGVLLPHIQKAERLAEELKPFSFDEFKRLFYSVDKIEKIESKKNDNVLEALKLKAKKMEKEGRLGSGDSYKNTGISIKRFIDSFNDEERAEFLNIQVSISRYKTKSETILRFEHITPAFLQKYETWMLKFGKAAKKQFSPNTPATLTTIGIYCRQLRSVYNDAINENIVDSKLYPFGNNRYKVPAGSNVKKSVSTNDIKKILNYKDELSEYEQRSLDLWVFSYLSNGMNMTDICNIKWLDIDKNDSSLSFARAKTLRTRKSNQSKIYIKLIKRSWEIINRYATKENAESYVFPFINALMTNREQKSTVAQIVKVTNSNMKKLAKKLDIQSDLSTYVARHSFATILVQGATPIAFISQALGHQSISTTESYLGSFDREKANGYLGLLDIE